jgi:hypothetical protein
MRTKAKFYVLLVYRGFQKKGKLSLEYPAIVSGIIPVGPFGYLCEFLEWDYSQQCPHYFPDVCLYDSGLTSPPP